MRIYRYWSPQGVPKLSSPHPCASARPCLFNQPLLTLYQVWDHVTQSYVTQDKYQGREIKKDEFSAALGSFLYDGERLLAYQIPGILGKIYALARIINRLKGFRFYGCSLLFIYDGDHEVQEALGDSYSNHPTSRRHRGESLERHRRRYQTAEKPSPDLSSTSLRRSHSDDVLGGPIDHPCSPKRRRGEVNIRIVDFAHMTTGHDWLTYPEGYVNRVSSEAEGGKGYTADVDSETGLIYARFPPHNPGEPDRGFLFGLKSLAESLEKIYNDERLRQIKSRGDLNIATSIRATCSYFMFSLLHITISLHVCFAHIIATSFRRVPPPW